MDEYHLHHPFLHPIYEGPERDSVLVGDQAEGVAYHVLEAEACEVGVVHHKTALEVV